MATWTADEHTVQRWLKEFCKGDENLEMRCTVAHRQKLTTTNWSSYNYMRSRPRTQHRPFYGHLAREASWEGEMGVLWADHKSEKSSWSVIFSYHMQQQGTISPSVYDVWRKVGFIQQPVMKSSVVGPRRNSKRFWKLNLHPKKAHGHSLVVCCLSDPLQLSESQWNQYIWEVCSANRWDASKTATPASIGQQRANSSPQPCLTACHTTNASKVEQIGLQSCASSTTFTWPLTKNLPLL